MATIGPLALTYADWARRIDDDGRTAEIIEILSQTNDILDDLLVVEGNSPTGHKTTIRTGLPQATWRQYNVGIQPTKSVTAQITESFGMLETYSMIDKALCDLNGNTAEFRLSEDMAFLEGMNQQMAGQMIYGSSFQNPERFNGLSVRYNTVNSANALNATNVIDAGGVNSTNTSLWLVTWGALRTAGLFPKGQRGGLQINDKKDVRALYDANNRPYEGYTTHFKWDMGLVVRDWRYNVRIANIDVTTLGGAAPPNLIVSMIRAIHRMPTQPASAGTEQKTDAKNETPSMGRCAFYANRTVRTWLDIQAVNKANVLLRLDEFDGKPITTFRGIPVRTCDQILSTEARII